MDWIARDSGTNNEAARLNLVYKGVRVVVWKRRVHQWRTDLMIHVDGREAYLTRHEGGMTRGDVKRLAREWMETRGRSVLR